MQVDNGVKRDISLFGCLAHQLAVQLAFGRHVDEQVAPDRGLATQAPPRFQGQFPLAVFLFRYAERGEVFLYRGNAELGEIALGAGDLATAAQAASAAH